MAPEHWVNRTVCFTSALLEAVKAHAAAREVSEAAVIRQSMTLGLRVLAEAHGSRLPDPIPSSLTNGMTHYSGLVMTGDPRLDQVWRVLAERRWRQRAGKVTNVGPWMRKVAANAKADGLDLAADLLRRYPDLTCDELARVLDGDTEPLRYARRADERMDA